MINPEKFLQDLEQCVSKDIAFIKQLPKEQQPECVDENADNFLARARLCVCESPGFRETCMQNNLMIDAVFRCWNNTANLFLDENQKFATVEYYFCYCAPNKDGTICQMGQIPHPFKNKQPLDGVVESRCFQHHDSSQLLLARLVNSGAKICDYMLCRAVKDGDRQLFDYLAMKRPNYNPNTILTAVVEANCIDLVDSMLNKGASVDCRNFDDMTLLAVAIEQRALPMMQKLIAAGADVNSVSWIGHYTPLQLAARCTSDKGFCKDAIDLLLDNGADIHKRTRECRNALCRAAQAGNLVAVEVLLSNGARATDQFFSCCPYDPGSEPLYLAAQNKHAKVVCRLLRAGAKITHAVKTCPSNDEICQLLSFHENVQSFTKSFSIQPTENKPDLMSDSVSIFFPDDNYGDEELLAPLVELTLHTENQGESNRGGQVLLQYAGIAADGPGNGNDGYTKALAEIDCFIAGLAAARAAILIRQSEHAEKQV